jgi:Mrp family chromosome partitioning ATPase
MSVIAASSGKGSPGATFVAVNLAAAMARTGEDVLLLDLDPSGGDVCCYLGLDPRRGLYPLLRMEGGIPGPERLLEEAEERAGFLAVCGFPEPSNLASSGMLLAAVQAGRGTGRTVLADLGRASEAAASVASRADRLLLVVRPDLVSVLGAERALRMLEPSIARGRIGAVLSGLERRRPGDRAEVGEALRLPIAGALPPDARGARKALLKQAPASTKRLRRAFDSLAADPRGGAVVTSDAEESATVVEPVEARA